MDDVMRVPADEMDAFDLTKDRSCLLSVIRQYLQTGKVDVNQPVLVLGGEQEDLAILSSCGFSQIVLSNLRSSATSLDAENIALPDESYPLVFAHAVLHHCRCPQKALGEMIRVSQKHVFFVEPNDSWALSMLVRLKISFPYELAAVVAHEYKTGGMRDGPIPNYIYRWTRREVEKAAFSYHPERRFSVQAHAYWDFYVNEYELLSRRESRASHLARAIGALRFIRLLHFAQSILNVVPLSRSQGNKFFCAVSKDELHPWIELRKGHCSLREYGSSVKPRKSRPLNIESMGEPL